MYPNHQVTTAPWIPTTHFTAVQFSCLASFFKHNRIAKTHTVTPRHVCGVYSLKSPSEQSLAKCPISPHLKQALLPPPPPPLLSSGQSLERWPTLWQLLKEEKTTHNWFVSNEGYSTFMSHR